MQTFASLVNYQEKLKTIEDFRQLLKQNNILQPLDILGGYSVCDFYTNDPIVIQKGLGTLGNGFKETIIYDFLEIKYPENGNRISELEKLGLVLNPYEVSSGMDMMDPIQSAFDAK